MKEREEKEKRKRREEGFLEMTWKWWRRATRVNGLSHFFITCVAADVSSLKIYLSPSKNKKKKKDCTEKLLSCFCLNFSLVKKTKLKQTNDERAISEEDGHENEVKDIQGKIFKENQFRKTADADMGGTPSMSNSQN